MRPATPLICEFIDTYKHTYGVAPICRALVVHGVQIAPRTYWAHRSSAPSKRELWDTTIAEILAGYFEPDAEGKRPPESLYGSLKMWAHLQRQGIPVARCTVEKIMRRNGWRGVTRARRPPRTTEPDPAANRAPDLVGRRWRVAAPNLLEVADFTYVAMTGGFGYTAFVIDAYAGLIPGWECSLSKTTDFVERALRHAAAFRTRQGHPFDDTIHHSDAGSQYTAIHFGESLMLAGLKPSIGTVGDALDNALAETTIGLYKTECVREGSPFRSGLIDRHPLRLGEHDLSVGELVQRDQAHAPPWPASTRRSRSRVLHTPLTNVSRAACAPKAFVDPAIRQACSGPRCRQANYA